MEKKLLHNLAVKIAKSALRIKAIKLSTNPPFEWASRYFMPIYNDNRMFLFFPGLRLLIIEALAELINANEIEVDVIAGTSTAGIPWGCLLAEKLGLPFIYIRGEDKPHGLKNRIEGIDAESDLGGKKVIVIEDLVSTGGSSAKAVQSVRDANGVVTHCISIFSYGLDKAVNAFDELPEPVIVKSLLEYDTLLEVALSEKYLTGDQIELLKDWRQDPFEWGKKNAYPRKEEEKK
ncbi:orotate phosphoribosyltransferase [Patescibacteria group bacterium]|nr:orotate phosphoribosyltransferase [Patescibacteria group bacterium]MBU1757912.1 orotate phosphoribosyltransferase [Patescibacteria group bacterium]